MKTKKILAGIMLTAVVIAVAGCGSKSQLKTLKTQTQDQQEQIKQLETQLSDRNQAIEQKTRELNELRARAGQDGVNTRAQAAYIKTLESDLQQQKNLAARQQSQLTQSGTSLPADAIALLKNFADAHSGMISFDEAACSLRFESGMQFKLGSDEIKDESAKLWSDVAEVLNKPQLKPFDLVIAGYTDNMPIKRPEVLKKHPTNWHLSVHRAIAVLDILSQNQVAEARMTVKGYGEYHPIAINKPNKGGNPANCRVEIFVVPAGK